MGKISDYSIYCTEEQTKKAFELGAPLSVITAKNEKVIEAYKAFANGKRKNECTVLDNFQESCGCHLIANPTAEQMIGWLEKQGLWEIQITRKWRYNGWYFYLYNSMGDDLVDFETTYLSRKEVTLAAIDAALNYLIKKRDEDE